MKKMYIVAFAKTLGGLCIGYTSGIVGCVIIYLDKGFPEITTTEKSVYMIQF